MHGGGCWWGQALRFIASSPFDRQTCSRRKGDRGGERQLAGCSDSRMQLGALQFRGHKQSGAPFCLNVQSNHYIMTHVHLEEQSERSSKINKTKQTNRRKT